MLKISEIDKLRISNASGPIKLNIEGVNYYFKKDPDFAEILGEELAKIIGLECAHYEPIIIDGINYVASLDLNNTDKFNLFVSYIKEGCLFNLYSIWNPLEENFKDVTKLMESVTLMYIFDLLFMNCDRHFENFGVLENNPEQLIILDNGLIFDEYLPPTISSIYGEDDQLNSYYDLENYLNDSSEEFIETFIKIFDSLPPERFNEVLEEVEKKRNIKLNKKIKWQFLYRTNYEKIKEIIEKYRGENYAR